MGGDVVLVAEDGGQCQHAVPHRVVAVFQSHAGVLGELGQRLLEVSLCCLDIEGLGLDHGRDGRQHGHHHLLTVAKAAIGGLDAEAHEGDGIGHLPVDGNCLAAHRVERQVELAASVDVARSRVKQFDDGITGGCLVGGILHGGSQRGLVALSQEARHVGAYHQRLLSQDLCHPGGADHLLVPCYGLGNPRGIEVGCFKFQRDDTVLVAGEHWLPQRGLDVALAQGDLVQVLLIHLSIFAPFEFHALHTAGVESLVNVLIACDYHFAQRSAFWLKFDDHSVKGLDLNGLVTHISDYEGSAISTVE